MQPTLFLIPTPLGSPDTPCLLPHEQKLLAGLTDFVVEGEKTARACLRHFGLNSPLQELSLRTLNKHTEPAEMAQTGAGGFLAFNHEIGEASQQLLLVRQQAGGIWAA